MARVLVLTVFLTLLSLGSLVPVGNKRPAPGNSEGELSIFEILTNANSGKGDMLTEGDIMKPEANNGSPDGSQSNAHPCTFSSSNCKWPKIGEYVDVPVVISSDFSKSHKDLIKDVMAGFEAVTCVRFDMLNKGEQRQRENYLHIIPDIGCWSYVGRTTGVQELSLQSTGCMYKQIIQHEILHALGLVHEQNRSDRDDYVDIIYENIRPDAVSNFQMSDTNNLLTEYDFHSVLHYSNWAFSANGEMTIVAKHDPSYTFGNAQAMSANDVIRVNRLYNCTNYQM